MITREATSKKALGQTKIEILEDSQLESKKTVVAATVFLFTYLCNHFLNIFRYISL